MFKTPPLQRLLLMLAFVAVLPILVLATLLIVHTANTEQNAVGRGLTDAARSISIAVDREIVGSITTLQGLAASRSLEAGNVKLFREEMTRAFLSQREAGWVNVRLADGNGTQLVSVREPSGPSPDPDPRSLEQATATGRPTIMDVVRNPVTKSFTWGIRLPVVKAGRVRYVLTALVSPETMRAALASYAAGSDRVAVLYDRNDTIVYRTLNADRLIGTPITPKLAQWSRAEASGIVDDVNREGTPIRTAFSRSAAFGWGVGVGVPHAVLFAPARWVFSGLGASALCAVLLSLLGVLILQHRIQRPMVALAAAAQRFPDPDARVTFASIAAVPGARETASIAHAFATAAHTIDRALTAEREARAVVEAATRAKDDFLALVSHELRTPLNSVYGWARMLQSGQVRDPAHALEVILRNADAQVQLIDDLLDVARALAGKMRLDVQSVAPYDVVQHALEAIQHTAAAKGVRIQPALDPRAGPVAGDPARLQQVVWNLLANAVKFTPKGGRVQVRLERANSHVDIIVSDTGQGIPAEVLPFVFDRFQQRDSSSTRRQGGLGLGLALVKHLVELHGGSVAAQSAGEEQGTTFIVRLPVIIAEVEAATTPFAQPRLTGTSALNQPRLDGLRILVVDDDADALDLATAILSGAKATVRTARSAAEGLRIFEQWRPDVLLSDIEMPDEDGYALIRKIRARSVEEGGKTPAISLTAYGRTGDRLVALNAGYNMHVPKPVDPVELLTIIASLCER